MHRLCSRLYAAGQPHTYRLDTAQNTSGTGFGRKPIRVEEGIKNHFGHPPRQELVLPQYNE